MRAEDFEGARMDGTKTWVAIAVVLLLAGCAHQPPPLPFGDFPGFFGGLWHGLVAPFALVGSLFAKVRIYAFPNAGGWYDLGFLLGLSAWGGGAAAGRRRR